jgi:fructokinase
MPPGRPSRCRSCRRDCRFLHFGSISLLQQPAASRIAELVAANRGRCVIVFDPNVRPSLIADMASYRERVAGWFTLADLVKLSDEDAELLAPGQPVEALAAQILQAGARARHRYARRGRRNVVAHRA